MSPSYQGGPPCSPERPSRTRSKFRMAPSFSNFASESGSVTVRPTSSFGDQNASSTATSRMGSGVAGWRVGAASPAQAATMTRRAGTVMEAPFLALESDRNAPPGPSPKKAGARRGFGLRASDFSLMSGSLEALQTNGQQAEAFSLQPAAEGRPSAGEHPLRHPVRVRMGLDQVLHAMRVAPAQADRHRDARGAGAAEDEAVSLAEAVDGEGEAPEPVGGERVHAGLVEDEVRPEGDRPLERGLQGR